MAQFSNLGKRIATAAIGGSAFIGLLHYGQDWGAQFLAAVLSLGMAYEWGAMTFQQVDRKEKQWVLLLAIMVFHTLSFQFEILSLIVMLFILGFTYFLLAARRYESSGLKSHLQEFGFWATGLVYCGVLPLFLGLLRKEWDGLYWVFLLLILVWVADSGAYFVGSKWGKRKLYPLISPKKSIEGAVGGLVFSFVAALFYAQAFLPSLPWHEILIISVLINAAALVGDLCESMLKRGFEVKDSGTLLPGHGGFLDRFDSIVFALPVLFLYVKMG